MNKLWLGVCVGLLSAGTAFAQQGLMGSAARNAASHADSASGGASAGFGLRMEAVQRKAVPAPYSDVRLNWRGKTYQVRLFDGVSQSLASASNFASQCNRSNSKVAVQEVLSLAAVTPQAELLRPDGSANPLTLQLRLIVQRVGQGCAISSTVADEQQVTVLPGQQNSVRMGSQTVSLYLLGHSPR
jgi:hypothetical protein